MAKIILLLDVDVRPILGEILRQRGYYAVHVLDAGRTGQSDAASQTVPMPVQVVQVVQSRSNPCGGSKFKVQEFKVILRPVPTVPAVPNACPEFYRRVPPLASFKSFETFAVQKPDRELPRFENSRNVERFKLEKM